jgi:hypothetical protein
MYHTFMWSVIQMASLSYTVRKIAIAFLDRTPSSRRCTMQEDKRIANALSRLDDGLEVSRACHCEIV